MKDTIPLLRETVQQALDALEDTVRWRATGIGRPPEQTAMDAITALSAALQQAEPQAQAGEPEVVAWRWKNSLGEVVTDWLPFDAQKVEYLRQQVESVNGTIDYAITLQAHREAMAVASESTAFWGRAAARLEQAIAKKDAALTACVEALQSIDQQIDLAAYPSAPSVTLADELRDAITKAQEQLK